MFSSCIYFFLIVKLAYFVETALGLFHIPDCVSYIIFFLLRCMVSKRSCGDGVLTRHLQLLVSERGGTTVQVTTIVNKIEDGEDRRNQDENRP